MYCQLHFYYLQPKISNDCISQSSNVSENIFYIFLIFFSFFLLTILWNFRSQCQIITSRLKLTTKLKLDYDELIAGLFEQFDNWFVISTKTSNRLWLDQSPLALKKVVRQNELQTIAFINHAFNHFHVISINQLLTCLWILDHSKQQF